MKKLKQLLKQLKYIFNRKQKVRFVFLFIIFLIAGLFELIGVAAVVPLINVMMTPETIERRWYLKLLYDGLSFSNERYFLVFLGITLIVIYVLKNLITSLMYKLQYRFTFSNQRDLAKRLMKCYMRQPYLFHTENNSADLIRSINSDVAMMFQAVISMLQMISEVIVCLTIGIYLIIKDKSITIGILLFMAVFSLLYVKVFKKYLAKIGSEDRKYTAGIVKWLQQSFGGIKEIKVMGREEYFLDNFNYNYDNWAERERIYRYLNVAPRPIMEVVCVTALMSVIVLKLLNGTSSDYFISTIAIFAVAAFRLLPSFNRITSFLSVIMFNLPSFNAVYNDLKHIEDIEEEEPLEEHVEKLQFEDEICVKDLSFTYPNSEQKVLENVNLNIKKNQSVALIGSSGAGKTTLADIILGALTPVSGKIYVDGKDIFKNLPEWRKNLGYIPQSIYLMDDTIENNILFGAEEKVDMSRLNKAMEQAQIKEFVDALPDRIKTIIGEQGIRLSGGQRQRIGIARALYLNPDVLVLDEATSALDNDTEAAVMDAIETLAGQKTLIIIAHRLTTIKNCDVVYKVENGSIIMEGQMNGI